MQQLFQIIFARVALLQLAGGYGILPALSMARGIRLNINEYRALHGTSQAQAADELGCSRPVMSRWCSGQKSPSRYWWERIQAWSRGAITEDVPKPEQAHSPTMAGK